MKRMLVWYFAALCLCATAAHAAGTNAVKALHVHVMQQVVMFESDNSSLDTWKAARADAAAGQQALDQYLKPAIDAAAGKPDLLAAVKAFYITSKTYFDSVNTMVPLPDFDPRTQRLVPAPEAIMLKNNQAKMRQDIEAKGNAMLLEARLAGLVDG